MIYVEPAEYRDKWLCDEAYGETGYCQGDPGSFGWREMRRD